MSLHLQVRSTMASMAMYTTMQLAELSTNNWSKCMQCCRRSETVQPRTLHVKLLIETSRASSSYYAMLQEIRNGAAEDAARKAAY